MKKVLYFWTGFIALLGIDTFVVYYGLGNAWEAAFLETVYLFIGAFYLVLK